MASSKNFQQAEPVNMKRDEEWHFIMFVKWVMRILQLRNDLKTLANTKTASQLYKYFLGSWIIASSFNLVSLNFIPRTSETAGKI